MDLSSVSSGVNNWFPMDVVSHLSNRDPSFRMILCQSWLKQAKSLSCFISVAGDLRELIHAFAVLFFGK